MEDCGISRGHSDPARTGEALSSPLFHAVAPLLEKLPRGRFPTRSDLNRMIVRGQVTGGGRPLRFVAPDPAAGSQYEVRAYRAGEIVTREGNWHDLFNALVWLSFPRAKASINRGHYKAMSEAATRPGTEGSRGTARDVLTLFDEGGVIVASDAPGLMELARQFRWKELFWMRREEARRRMRFLVFGHAILEKALQPYKAVTAKALMLEVGADFFERPLRAQLDEADRRTAQWLEAPGSLQSTRSLAPLPVLGVPGWAENDHSAFYDDERVFRPGYRAPPAQGKAGT